MPERWRHLLVLSLAELLAMSLWFAATAVAPQLAAEWSLSEGATSTLTLAVQLGFVVGTLLSAMVNLPDRVSARHLVAISTVIAAALTAAMSWATEFGAWVIANRFATGLALAGVYPPGLKIVASWFSKGRGLAVGVMVAALTLGKALPYLLNGLELGLPSWRTMLLAAAAIALSGALVTWVAVRDGPLLAQARAFHWRHALLALRDSPTRLANYGYFGHMWELYAMWTWAPTMLLASFSLAGYSEAYGRIAGFSALAAGALGCVAAGALADRLGRTTIAIASLAISGACCLVVGLAFAEPFWLLVLCLIWGFAVVADSAQFSAAISELADPRYVGTALTVQTCIGFLITMITIAWVPWWVAWDGWRWAFAVLALGPVFGIVSMLRLRRLPRATQMAHGRR